MLIDTHCHLNFKTFAGNVGEVIRSAGDSGVETIVVPGTDIESSKKAIEIAEKHEGVFAAVGIHPHHVFEIFNRIQHRVFSSTSPPLGGGSPKSLTQKQVSSLSILLKNTKTVAIGEVGIDRHIYNKTKYENYDMEEGFVDLQKLFLIEQIKLANDYQKALIMHNREAKKDLLQILSANLSLIASNRVVFHCCEPDFELLEFAKKNKIFIGVDGDVVYWKEKQEFVKEIPSELLVLETDSPFLSPVRKFPNEPKNIMMIVEFISRLKNIPIKEVEKKTTENAKKLFRI